MNRQVRTALFALIFLALVAGVGILVLSQKQDVEVANTVPSDNQAVLTDVDVNDSTAQSSRISERTKKTASTPSDDDNVEESDEAKQQDQQAKFNEDVMAEFDPEAGPFGGKMLFDPEDVAVLLEEYGSYEAIYDKANKHQRMDLIDALSAEENLRDELAALLIDESDPELRTYMLERVVPEGYFYDDETMGLTGEPDVDDELIDILDQPTQTPITKEEWIARMDLANLLEQEYAMKWVKNGRQVFPDDPDVNMLASTLTLNISVGTGNVSGSDTEWAVNYITNELGGENRGQYSSDQRIRAYYAMYFTDDKQQAGQFFEDQREIESDIRAQKVLDGLLDKLNRDGGIASVGQDEN